MKAKKSINVIIVENLEAAEAPLWKNTLVLFMKVKVMTVTHVENLLPQKET